MNVDSGRRNEVYLHGYYFMMPKQSLWSVFSSLVSIDIFLLNIYL